MTYTKYTMPSRFYENTIWTNHALRRLQDRRLSQDMAWKTFQYPDTVIANRKDGSAQYKRRFGIHTVSVIAKQNENNEWIVLSCWMDPPIKGTADDFKRQRYYRYKNANLPTKLLMQINRLLFGLDF